VVVNVQDAISTLFRDRKKLIETLVPIENKDRQIVPFVLNPIQSAMHTESTGRDVTVKPAQVGGTSYYICDFLLDCIMYPGTTAVIISYDEFITGRLLRKAQSFYDNLKIAIPSIPRLHHKSVSEKTFIFEDSLGTKRGESSIYIASAKGFSMPRGEPIHDLLLDELGFWPAGAAADTFAASIQRVPLLENTKIKALSTPNGEDNDFYELYMSAKEGKAVGKSVFKHHFYPWYMMPEYSMTADSPFVLPGDNTPELDSLNEQEQKLHNKLIILGFEVEDIYNKLRWRRYKNAEMQSLRRSGETRLLFDQEYPEDDVSCFLSASDQWYPSEQINRLMKNCYPTDNQYMGMDIWYPPEPGVQYLMAIDPGLGKASDSVATIWMFTETEFRHCATFSGKYAGKEMANKCMPLANYYNHCLIAFEDALDITGHMTGYDNLYYRTDLVTGLVKKDLGWQTNPATKVYMCNELLRSLPLINTHDARIVQQCRNIREGKSRGRVIPLSVGDDDFHDSAAIAIVCRNSQTLTRGYVGEKG
jgi:hypothetical protein